MAKTRITIPGHLILPYGTAHARGQKIKDLSSIVLKAVATNGIYMESDVPVVYIDTSRKRPLKISDMFAYEVIDQTLFLGDSDDLHDVLGFAEDQLAALIDTPTPAQREFLRLYFKYLLRSIRMPWYPSHGHIKWVYN